MSGAFLIIAISVWILAGCSSFGQPASTIGLCESVTQGLFCAKQSKEEGAAATSPKGHCHPNGKCNDPAMQDKTAIEIETLKH